MPKKIKFSLKSFHFHSLATIKLMSVCFLVLFPAPDPVYVSRLLALAEIKVLS